MSESPRARRSPSVLLIAAVAVALVAASVGFGSAASLSTTTEKIFEVDEAGLGLDDPAASTCTIVASDHDSYLNNNQGNLNSEASLGVRTANNDNNWTFVHFDLTGNCKETGRALPSGAGVSAATLRMHMHTAPSANRTYNVHLVTGGSWTEGTITWANMPAVAASATASTTTGTTDRVWKEWTVTEDVQALWEPGVINQGWAIQDSVQNNGTAYDSWFCSKDGGVWWLFGYCTSSYRPQLVVAYQPTTDTCTLIPSADSYVDSWGPLSNYDYDDDLWVYGSGALNGVRRIYLQFDLAGGTCLETGEAMPWGSSALTATLYAYKQNPAGANRTGELWRVTGSWSETGITWNNQPGVAATASASTTITTVDEIWHSWDVSTDVGAFLSGNSTNYGWRLRDSNEGSYTTWAFCGKTGGAGANCATSGPSDTRPKLVVSYDRPFSETCTLLATEDTYVNKGSGNTNYNGNSYLLVSGFELFVHDVRRSYLKYTLSSGTTGNCLETGAAMPAGATILRATVRIHVYEPPNASRPYELQRLTGQGSDTLPWAQGTLTWNGQDTYTAATTSTATVTTSDNTWAGWDATSDAQAFWAGSATNYGWRITESDEDSSRDTRFCGISGGDAACDTSGGAGDERPKLVIIYQRS